MSQPTSILADVRGMARDHDISNMPRGFVWDLANWIPDTRGAKLEARAAWAYFATSSFPASPWGGKHAAFRAGTSLLVGAGGNLYSVDLVTGAVSASLGAVPAALTNGSLVRDRVYFADASGASVPKVVTRSGTTHSIANVHATAPKGSVLCAYKERLVVAGVPSPDDPSNVYFSPVEGQTTQGPLSSWDAKSVIGTTRAVTGLFPMSSQIVVFHDGSIERIRGSIPPSSAVDSDMSTDIFSTQIGCTDPASIIGYQENVCFASPHGVFLSDGATIRSLTDQGGISGMWRDAYLRKKAGTQVHATIFRDMLFVSILTSWASGTADELRPMTLVCDLVNRTWFRLRNVHVTCFIDSEIGGEEVWWGVDSSVAGLGSPRICKLSPMFYGPTEYDPEVGPGASPDAVDGNGLPVLTHIRTGWTKLGPEGVKRARHVYMSHLTQAQTTNKADVYQVGMRLSPYPNLAPMSVGKINANPRYVRNRLRVDRRGYGIQLDVEQQLPVFIARLYDLAVDQWPQDRGKL